MDFWWRDIDFEVRGRIHDGRRLEVPRNSVGVSVIPSDSRADVFLFSSMVGTSIREGRLWHFVSNPPVLAYLSGLFFNRRAAVPFVYSYP